MKHDILAYLNDELLAQKQGVTVTEDDELLIEGHIDSLGLVRLVSFIEDTFGLRVPPRDVTIDNFGSVARIVAYLETLGPAAARG